MGAVMPASIRADLRLRQQFIEEALPLRKFPVNSLSTSRPQSEKAEKLFEEGYNRGGRKSLFLP